MRIRLTVERSGCREVEADVHVDLPINGLRQMSPATAASAVDVLKHQLMQLYVELSLKPNP